jgi:glutathione-specific gamma-glutamylcyclotransferase
MPLHSGARRLAERRERRELALTRDLIMRAHPRPLSDDPHAMRLWTDEELEASLHEVLEETSAEAELWLFAYGSLMWKPEIEFAERRIATVKGWHRRFCLWQWRFRGTRECPGVMLALDCGGTCVGIVYKLTGPDLRSKIMPVWRREMRGNGYRARYVTANTSGGSVRALTFVVNSGSERYAGRLSDDAIADRIAVACGHVGPSAEYLLNTVAHCDKVGIHDRHLWRMQALVAERLNHKPRPRPRWAARKAGAACALSALSRVLKTPPRGCGCVTIQ